MDSHKIEGNVEDYCLVVQKNDRFAEYKIVTEKDKNDMHTRVIELADSPKVSSSKLMKIINDISTEVADLEKALESLREMCGDPTFASVFINLGGLRRLTMSVSAGKFRAHELGLVLHAINSLLDHNLSEAEVDNVEPDQDFVKTLAEMANAAVNLERPRTSAWFCCRPRQQGKL